MALSPVYVQQFADRFVEDYQANRKLANTVQEIHGVVGDAYKLKVSEAVDMSKHGAYGSDIAATDVNTTAPTVSFSDFDLKLVLDHFESLNINANVITTYSKLHGMAIGRREDQYVIDAVVADATKSVPVGTTNLTIDKLIAARKELGLDEVMGTIHIAIHQNNLESLLKDSSNLIGNYYYNDVRALVTGQVEYFMGMKFHVLGNRTINGVAAGLPKTGDNRTCIVYAEEAVTLAYRLDPRVQMTEVEQNFRVETLSVLSAGAKVGRPKGVCTIICDETK
jgi:hypothetical protein